MTNKELFIMLTQASDKSGMSMSRQVLGQIIGHEKRVITEKFPADIKIDVTLNADGEYDMSSVGKVIEVYFNDVRLSPCNLPDYQERMD